jgi:hypothetical protein
MKSTGCRHRPGAMARRLGKWSDLVARFPDLVESVRKLLPGATALPTLAASTTGIG